MFRLDLKDCCTCVPPRSEISLNIWLLDCCMARKPMRVKISCSMVYSKPQNSIWVKRYAVTTDGPFLTDCLTEWSRTVRNWRQRAYCKSGIEIGHEYLRTVPPVKFNKWSTALTPCKVKRSVSPWYVYRQYGTLLELLLSDVGTVDSIGWVEMTNYAISASTKLCS